jgi:hypothetical protein
VKNIELTEDFFEGAVSVERINGKLKPWRVHHTQKALFPSPDDILLFRMGFSSAVRLRFKTDATKAVLRFSPIKNLFGDFVLYGNLHYDFVIDNNILQSIEISSEDTEVIIDDIPSGDKIVEIWLPHNAPTEIKSMELNDGANAVVAPDDRIKWITYGSSITQCNAAHSPARIWPAIAARTHDLNLTSLGYGGQCHLDPMVGRMIRDLSADIITLKLGINVYGANSLNLRTFKSAVIGLIEIIREKHSDTPIGIISPIIAPEKEEADNIVGLTLQQIRLEIEDAVKRIKQTLNDEKLFYFDGLKIFGEKYTGSRLPDDLHPDAEGYEILGENIAERVLPVLLHNC